MRTILKEYYLQGKKHKEIAKELDTTPDAEEKSNKAFEGKVIAHISCANN